MLITHPRPPPGRCGYRVWRVSGRAGSVSIGWGRGYLTGPLDRCDQLLAPVLTIDALMINDVGGRTLRSWRGGWRSLKEHQHVVQVANGAALVTEHGEGEVFLLVRRLRQ
eukprot:7451463-Pyramimonas_sp.AAC.1